MAVIIDPAPDHRIKLGDEAVGRSATVLADNRLHLSQEQPDTFPRRLDQKFAVRIKPDILAKKVEAFGYKDSDGFDVTYEAPNLPHLSYKNAVRVATGARIENTAMSP